MKRLVVGITILIGVVSVPVHASSLPNPIGWWKLDEGTGTIAADSSGNGNNGVLINSPTWVSGALSNGLDVSGYEAYVDVPYWSGFALTNAMSLSIWMKLTSSWVGSPSEDQMFTMGWYDNGWALAYGSSGQIFFSMTSINGNSLASIRTIPTNLWTHVVATFDGTNASLYIDGLLDSSAQWTGQLLTNNSQLLIGSVNSGAIDDPRVYNCALTEAQVEQLYAQGDQDLDRLADVDEVRLGTNPHNPDSDGDGFIDGLEVLAGTDPLNSASHPNLTNGLVGWWKFDECSGTNMADSSGNGGDGVLSGGYTWTNGVSGCAVAFNGIDSGFQGGASNTNNPLAITTNAFTISFFLRTTNTTAYSSVIDRHEYGSPDTGYFVWWDTVYDRVVCNISGVGAKDVPFSDFTVNQWNHFAFTYDGTQIISYLDGFQESQTAASGNLTANSFALHFCSDTYGYFYWNGSLDEVRIYNRTLTPGEVTALAWMDSADGGLPNLQDLRLGINPNNPFTDGIPVAWLVKYGLNPLDPNVGYEDADADGYSNLQEYKFGTDPTNPTNYPSIPPYLIGWWTFDEGIGTTAADSSGYSNTLTLVGGATWTTGVFSNALALDGSSGFASVTNSAALNYYTNALTVSAWVNATNAVNGCVVSYRSQGTNSGWRLFYNIGQVTFQWASATGTWNSVSATGTYPSNQWTHLAVTFTPTNVVLYVDAAQVASNNTSGTALWLIATNGLEIGRTDDTSPYWLPGEIDDVRLYDTGLGSNDVTAIYNTDSVGDGIPNWWRAEYFDSGSTTNSSSCASCDPEGDGVGNLQKFQYGISPLVAYSITAPPQVISYSTGNSASVPGLGSGGSYTWSVDNGTITTGQGTPNITWTAGDTGIANLSAMMQTPNSGSSTFGGSASVAVNPCSLAAANLTAPPWVIAGSSNNTASLASPLTVLYSNFTNGPPFGLTQGSGTDSNFYGDADNTDSSGSTSADTVFRMASAGTLTTIYGFDSQHVTNGWTSYPPVQGGSSDTNDLYGVTYFGGTNVDLHPCTGDYPEVGFGTIYKLTQQGTLTTLHVFRSTPDGAFPWGGLVQGGGADSNYLYGVTEEGGTNGCSPGWGCCVTGSGTVFRVSTTNGGPYTVLHRFAAGAEGAVPAAGLVLTNGYLYGTTFYGGTNRDGTVFGISTNTNTTVFVTLHQFNGTDGANPMSALVQGRGADSTNFYGTTFGGGTNGDGTVFRVNTNGTTFTNLYQFSGTDGAGPNAGLTWGYDGYMYGTTWTGGMNNYGTVFRISSNGVFSTVYNFTGGMDGGYPDNGDSPGKGLQPNPYDGYMYGTTEVGGSDGNGTIYKLNTAMYTWSIPGGNGTITAGQGTPNIQWTAGTLGVCSICVTISNNQVCTTNVCTNVNVTVTSDTVGDGIPDWWRAEYFGGDGATTNSSSCATCDPYGIGIDNKTAYLEGRDPTKQAVSDTGGLENLVVYTPLE